MDISQSVVYLL